MFVGLRDLPYSSHSFASNHAVQEVDASVNGY